MMPSALSLSALVLVISADVGHSMGPFEVKEDLPFENAFPSKYNADLLIKVADKTIKFLQGLPFDQIKALEKLSPWYLGPEAQEDNYLTTQRPSFELLRRFSEAEDKAGASGSFDEDRLNTVQSLIQDSINPAKESVQRDFARKNADFILLALANFLGAFYGLLAKSNVFQEPGLLGGIGTRLAQAGQIFYGIGYSGQHAFEISKPNFNCGIEDYRQVETNYKFLENRNWISENPTMAMFYSTEEASMARKALYCIISKKGTNLEARRLDNLIRLQSELRKVWIKKLSENSPVRYYGST